MIIAYRQIDNSFWVLHDNLNSEVVFKSIPVQENLFFTLNDHTYVKGYMGDIPRSSYSSSPFSLISWAFYLLPASWAMLVIAFVGRCIAFFGMYYLIKFQLSALPLNRTVLVSAFFLAFGFAFLPVFTIHGWTIQGLPFLLLVLLRIKQNPRSRLNYLGVLFYGLGGNFVLGGFAVIALSFCFALYLILSKSRFAGSFLIACGFLTLGFVLSDIQLFLQFLFDHDFQSHRSLWQPNNRWTIKVVLYDIYYLLFFGHYHAPSLQLPLILTAALFVGFFWKRIQISKKLNILLAIVFFIALFHGLYKSQLTFTLKNSIGILKSFQFDRFYFINGVLWVIIFVEFIRMNEFIPKQKSIFLMSGCLIFSVHTVFNNPEILSNILGRPVNHDVERWDKYYYTEVRNQIDVVFPDKAKFKVLHCGIDPAVGCMLGFQTVDGYHTNYPAEIRQRFIDLVKLSESNDSPWKSQILNWGSRLKYSLNGKKSVELNWNMAREMNLKYVMSKQKLIESDHLKLANEFYDRHYDQAIFFYRIL
jgi:hypothetical protein